MNKLLERLQITAVLETPPKGAKTAEAWGKEWGFGAKHAADLLRRGIPPGVVKRIKVRIATSNGVRPVLHYMEVAPNKQNGAGKAGKSA